MTENKFKVNIPRAQGLSTNISGFDDFQDNEVDSDNFSDNDFDDFQNVDSDDDNEEDKKKVSKDLEEKKQKEKLKQNQIQKDGFQLKDSISNRMSIRLSQSVSLSMSQSQFKDELVPENFTNTTVFNLDRLNQIYEMKEKTKGNEQKKYLKKLKEKMESLRILKNDFTVNRKIATQNLLKFHRNDIVSGKNCIFLKLHKQIYKYTLDIDYLKARDVLRTDKAQFIALECLNNGDLLISDSDRKLFLYSCDQKDVLALKKEITCEETIVYIKQLKNENVLVSTKSFVYLLQIKNNNLEIDLKNPIFKNPLFEKENIKIDHRTLITVDNQCKKVAIALNKNIFICDIEKKEELLSIKTQNQVNILTFNAYNIDTLVVAEINQKDNISQNQNPQNNSNQNLEDDNNQYKQQQKQKQEIENPEVTVIKKVQQYPQLQEYLGQGQNQDQEEEITSSYSQYYLNLNKKTATKISEIEVFGEILDIIPNYKTKEMVLMRLDVDEKGQKITCFDIINNFKSKVKVIDSIENNHFIPLQNSKFDKAEELMFALGPDYIRIWKFYMPKEIKSIKDNLRDTLF